MTLLEAEVHSSLRNFLREQGKPAWPHHLTMARIVSRALRLQRSALIQTGCPVTRYCLSYLTPALLSNDRVLLVAPEPWQHQLLQVEIPRLQQGLNTHKQISLGDRALAEGAFRGLAIASTQAWLADRLGGQGRFPAQIPTLIDQAEELEACARKLLTVSLSDHDWDDLRQSQPQHAEAIRNLRVQLTKAIFSRPKNPYECYLIEDTEQDRLKTLLRALSPQAAIAPTLTQFWQQWQAGNSIVWAAVSRESGQFTLHVAPVEVNTALSPIWQQQPVVLMGSFLDAEPSASIYRQQVGLGELLCLKFTPSRQSESIRLYVPDRLPLPNMPAFQSFLLKEVLTLLASCSPMQKPVVVLVDDVPLKAQVGTALAAEFGSKVQLEKTQLAEGGILVCGWKFWHANQAVFPIPQLLIIATLPIPSLENPLVASQVAYYKRQRQDWFRLYLLPTALQEIQCAVMPVRESQGVVALLDNRVNSRSYGTQILNVLEPYARINYVDPSWFAQEDG
jgi:ATP-dependent DNA helicase DinG